MTPNALPDENQWRLAIPPYMILSSASAQSFSSVQGPNWFKQSITSFGNQLMSGQSSNVTEASMQTNMGFLRSKLDHSPDNVRNAIRIDPGVMHGNPVFRDTRIPVYQILEELADGTRLEELPESFPTLDREKVQAGLDFAISLLRIYDD